MRFAAPSASLLAPLAFLAVLAFASTAFADDDTVFLKNGKKVTGKVVSEDAKKGVTIELKDGKKKTFKPREVDHVQKAPPPEAPKPAAPPPKPPPPAAEPEEEPEPPPPPDYHVRKGLTFGAGLDGALVRAKSLGPQLGVHGIVDIGTGTPVYLRIEPGFSYWTRSTSLNALSGIELPADGSPYIETRSKITNNVRVLEGHAKLGIGVDLGQSFTARLAGTIGYATATTDATRCAGGRNSGLLYGASLVPIALRALEKKQLELGANVDYQRVPVPKCDSSVSGSLTIAPGESLTFDPAVKKQRVEAIFFGLHVSYLFK